MSAGVRYENAPDLVFSHDPQRMGGPAQIKDHASGETLGTVIRTKGREPGELQFRIYDADGHHHSDCGRFGDTFEVLEGFAAAMNAPAPGM